MLLNASQAEVIRRALTIFGITVEQARKHFDHLDLLDYARAVAIISVVAFHCLCASGAQLFWSTWSRNLNVPFFNLLLLPVNLGSLGVAIFFVVSGFCIHLSFQRQGRSYADFFIRRFFRIYPAYLAALLFFALLFPKSCLIFSGPSSNQAWTQLLSHLLLIHNFLPGTYMAINPAFWSLAIEVQLYVLYPILLFLVGQLGWKRTMVILAIIEAIIHTGKAVALLNETSGHHFLSRSLDGIFICLYGLGRSPFAYWFSWSLGALIADSYLQQKPQPLARVSPVVWVGCTALCFLVRPLSEFMFMMGCLASAAVLSRLLTNKVQINPDRFSLKFLSKIGTWSYSLYLLHQPLIWAVPIAWLSSYGHAAEFVFLGFAALAVVPLSFLLYRTVEAPSIKAAKNLIKMLRSVRQSDVELPVTAPSSRNAD